MSQSFPCNHGIEKDGKFKQCKLNINHIGNHSFENVHISHPSLKSSSLVILTQFGLWGGLILGMFSGGILWKMGNGMGGIGLGLFVFLMSLIGIVELASRIEKYWGMDVFKHV